jgi:hypothetical protein
VSERELVLCMCICARVYVLVSVCVCVYVLVSVYVCVYVLVSELILAGYVSRSVRVYELR